MSSLKNVKVEESDGLEMSSLSIGDLASLHTLSLNAPSTNIMIVSQDHAEHQLPCSNTSMT